MRIAATGLAKNIVPKRAKAQSKRSSNLSTWTSATAKLTVRSPASSASSLCRLDEARRDVDAEHRAGLADHPGDPLARVAEAATDVQHPLAGLAAGGRERRLAVRAEATGDDLPELDEAVEEDAVPGFERLLVVSGYPLHASMVAPVASGRG